MTPLFQNQQPVLNPGTERLTDFLRRVDVEVKRTSALFPKNVIKSFHWPMPFFGNVLTARVLTVGVNPSSTEFVAERNWKAVMNVLQWQDRMLNYFSLPHYPPHDWFATWSSALACLDLSYETGSAAHIDVSPRPTTAMFYNKQTYRPEFGQMAAHDVKWFFELLPLCPNVRLLLVAGPILRPDGKLQQLAAFLKHHAPVHGWHWLPNRPLSILCSRDNKTTFKVFEALYEPGTNFNDSLISQIHQARQEICVEIR